MATAEQSGELESLIATYDGASDVKVKCSGVSLRISVSLTFSNTTMPLPQEYDVDTLPPVSLSISLPSSYLATDEPDVATPTVHIESAWLSQEQSNKLCEHLKELACDSVGEPVLIMWVEWLRLEAVPFLTEGRLKSCSNCSWNVKDSHELTCGHELCTECVAVTSWVYSNAQVQTCCPVKCCDGVLKSRPGTAEVDASKLKAGIGRICESQFQSSVVFCPLCESVGVETVTLCKIELSEDPSKISQVPCRCPECHWEFCGVCQSPCHPGEPCLAQGHRAKRMTTRRPSLPDHFLEAAYAATSGSDWVQSTKRETYEIGDFNSFRRSFINLHRTDLLSSLEQVFGETQIEPAPVSAAVAQRFMHDLPKAFKKSSPSACRIRAGFHGTDLKNHESICDRGLLIPGQGNELRIVNGAVHGRGVYVARKHAAWLSFGFCSSPKMFICAVLDLGCVTYPGDAMVVANSAHVVPLFIAAGSRFRYASVVPSGLSRKAQIHVAGTVSNVSKAKPLTVERCSKKNKHMWCDEEYDIPSDH